MAPLSESWPEVRTEMETRVSDAWSGAKSAPGGLGMAARATEYMAVVCTKMASVLAGVKFPTN